MDEPWLTGAQSASSTSGSFGPLDIEPERKLEGVGASPGKTRVTLRPHVGVSGNNQTEMDLPRVWACRDIMVDSFQAMRYLWGYQELLPSGPEELSPISSNKYIETGSQLGGEEFLVVQSLAGSSEDTLDDTVSPV